MLLQLLTKFYRWGQVLIGGGELTKKIKNPILSKKQKPKAFYRDDIQKILKKVGIIWRNRFSQHFWNTFTVLLLTTVANFGPL